MPGHPARPGLAAALSCVVVALLAGCASSSPGSGPTTAPTSSATGGVAASSGVASPSAGATETSGGAALPPADLPTRPAVAAAVADAARRAGVSPGDVVVAAWSPVTWSDGSLGCPEKGKAYTQATVPGELLILRVESGLYQYHAAGGEPFRYCAEPSAGYTVGN